MEKLEYLYDKYVSNFKCKYYIIKSQKTFADNGDRINMFGIKIDKLNNRGRIIASTRIDNVGINKDDVKECINGIKSEDMLTDRAK